jgi:deazaflavin-dependent oxidoreductase (nitroreductase family)
VARASEFRPPSRVERVFNRLFGVLVRLGVGLRHNYVVEVRGRTTGRVYATPVNLLELRGRRFLVAPRGRTQWVRNAEAAGHVTLARGSRREEVRVARVPNAEKAEILAAYLTHFRLTVQRYFPVRAGAPVSAFRDVLDDYPVFELLPAD